MENIKYKNIHFLGIGGISQSALATILKAKGHNISGSDRAESSVIRKLRGLGIDVCINGVSERLKDADLIVVSAAIKDDDEELLQAKALNKHIISRAEMLGMVAKTHSNVISIAGSHGKTTTTGMISQIFLDAGLDPTIHIGGELPIIQGNVCVGSEEYFITEACEYVDSFLSLKSNVSVILNIQSDHLDYFKTLENIKKSFNKFAKNTKKKGLIVYSGEDNNINLTAKRRDISFAIGENGVLCARNIKEYVGGKYQFDCYFLNHKLFPVKLGVFGLHNVANALASIAVALEYGIDYKTISKSLKEFKGVRRRFDDCGSVEGIRVVHDYAHHPTEIKATIEIAQSITKGDIYVVFQPHTYSRTALLLEEFKSCFNFAKEVIVYKVYPARETKDQGVDERELAKELMLTGKSAVSFDNYEEMKKYIKYKVKKNDMLLVLGAGDIESFTSFYLNE